MKKNLYLLVFTVLSARAVAQTGEVEKSSWQFNPDISFYFIEDDFFILPVFRADKNKLHLEARYNYEDRETFSGWVGYNISGGNKLSYLITPMIGGVVGLTDGFAPGLEFTLALGRFELYNEMEYLFAANEPEENSYFYSWSDLTFSPTDWLWLGISGQRTRVYQTDVDFQRGLLIGAGLKSWELSSYFFNIDTDNPFLLVNLAVTF
ncbi:MAG TPA: hypothetical protein VFZ52_20600 [Chryseolinea sp.]